MSFVEWLRAEIEHAGRLDPCPYVVGRRQALREVKLAHDREQLSDHDG